MNLPQKSRLLLNLTAQLCLLIACGIASAAAPAPIDSVAAAAVTIVSWSLTLGLIYSVLRVFGARIEAVEWYYQNVPVGMWSQDVIPLENIPTSPGQSIPPPRLVSSAAPSSPPAPINWNKFLSVEYIRYAGLLLIITSLFAFLFRIEWSLPAKIAASLCGATGSLLFAEFLHRKQKATLSGSCFLGGIACLQFAATLCLRYFQGAPVPGLLGSLDVWLIVKVGMTAVAGLALFRYKASFVPLGWLLIAYATPLSAVHVVSSIPTISGLAIALALTVLSIAFAVPLRNHGVVLANSFLANILAITFSSPTHPSWIGRADQTTATYAAYSSSLNIQLFATVAFIFLLHLVAGVAFAIARKPVGTDAKTPEGLATIEGEEQMAIFESVAAHTLGAGALIAVQATIPSFTGFYGVTLLLASCASFISLLVVRQKGVQGMYVEVLLNLALLMSVIGMFLNTHGAWTAIVFLFFSCFIIYLSFVLGTLRTRVYAFAALTVSMFKLYFECSELFNSIPGTAFVLIAGVVLTVLSYKLEGIKAALTNGKS
jgi:hypothetical protein